jgi:hypothetical protein
LINVLRLFCSVLLRIIRACSAMVGKLFHFRTCPPQKRANRSNRIFPQRLQRQDRTDGLTRKDRSGMRADLIFQSQAFLIAHSLHRPRCYTQQVRETTSIVPLLILTSACSNITVIMVVRMNTTRAWWVGMSVRHHLDND